MPEQIKRPQILDLKMLALETILLRYTTSSSIIQKLPVCMFRIRSLLRPFLLIYTVFVKTHSIYLSMWRNLNGIKIRSQELGVWQGIIIIICFNHSRPSLFLNNKNEFKSSS